MLLIKEKKGPEQDQPVPPGTPLKPAVSDPLEDDQDRTRLGRIINPEDGVVFCALMLLPI